MVIHAYPTLLEHFSFKIWEYFLVSGCKTKKSLLTFKATGFECCQESQTSEKDF